MMWDDGQRRR